jgi:hypothetical protein
MSLTDFFGSTDPHKRKGHVKRVYKVTTDSSTGEKKLDKSVWIDVLRFENVFVEYRGLKDGKTTGMRIRPQWKDDPNKDDAVSDDLQMENNNQSRKCEELKITEKNTTSGDPGLSLWIVDKAKITTRGGSQPGEDSGQNYQSVNFVFNNVPADGDKPANRKVTTVVIVNNDLGGSDRLNMDDRRIVDWEEYLDALNAGKKDKSQKLKVEIPDNFSVVFGADTIFGQKGQIIKFRLANNDEVEKLYKDDPDTAEFLNDETKQPLRLDPLQIIVNVKLRPPYVTSVFWDWVYQVTKESIVDDLGGRCDEVKIVPREPPQWDNVFPSNANALNCGYVQTIFLKKRFNPTSPVDSNNLVPNPDYPKHSSEPYIKGKLTFKVTPSAPETISFGTLVFNGSVWTDSRGKANDPQFPGVYSAVGKSSAELTKPLYAVKLSGSGPGWWASQQEIDNPEAASITMFYCDGYTTPDSYGAVGGDMSASISGSPEAKWKSNDGKQEIDFELYAVSIVTNIGAGYPTVGPVDFTAYFKEKGSKTPDYPKT